jgi:sacsin
MNPVKKAHERLKQMAKNKREQLEAQERETLFQHARAQFEANQARMEQAEEREAINARQAQSGQIFGLPAQSVPAPPLRKAWVSDSESESLPNKGDQSEELAAKNAEIDALKSRFECSICFKNEKDTALIPCGHTLCNECTTIYNYNTGSYCPICNREIENIQKIFYGGGSNYKEKYLKYKNKYLQLKSLL